VIPIDPENIEGIRGWTTPRNFSEVISFMGLASYYLRLIKGFSKLLHMVLKSDGVI
jgi:hypothetical protein